MWRLYSLRRRADLLLCVVRWVHPDRPTEPFSLAEVNLTETAVRWQYYGSVGAARAEMELRCTAPATPDGGVNVVTST